ncbi:MAG: transposase [Gemmatimonadaceae bacterium]
MSRYPRSIFAGTPLHVIQRGNNRAMMFLDPTDNALFKMLLQESSAKHCCPIHAYTFMGNHVHLLVTPSTPLSVSRMMHLVGTRYVRYFNHRYERTGTLWEGRFRSTTIHSARYFFTCSRYIELNPVRALMVEKPSAYVWSSYARNALGSSDGLITEHTLYRSLGRDSTARQTAYRAMFATHLDTEMDDAVHLAAQIDRKNRSNTFEKKPATFHNRMVGPRGGDRRSALCRHGRKSKSEPKV